MESVEQMIKMIIIYASVSMTAFFLFYITLNIMYNRVIKLVKIRRNNESKQNKR